MNELPERFLNRTDYLSFRKEKIDLALLLKVGPNKGHLFIIHCAPDFHDQKAKRLPVRPYWQT